MGRVGSSKALNANVTVCSGTGGNAYWGAQENYNNLKNVSPSVVWADTPQAKAAPNTSAISNIAFNLTGTVMNFTCGIPYRGCDFNHLKEH